MEYRMFDPLDDQLGDPVAAAEPDRLARVVVDQADLDLAAVAGVDRAGGVDHAQAGPGRQTGAGVHEGGEPVGQRDGHTRADDDTFTWRDVHVRRGHEV